MGNPVNDSTQNLPEPLRARLAAVDAEVNEIIERFTADLKTALPPVSLQFKYSAEGDLLSVEERAQSVSFVARYEQIPVTINAQLVETAGAWHIENVATLGHVLSDFRPFIQNKRDSVHFQNMHNVWYRMLLRQDAGEGMVIRAWDAQQNDITPLFRAWVGERNRAMKHLLGALEYDYLFNGVLQHSDARYADRFWSDYTSGELNYVLWKHVRPLGLIKDLLLPYYTMARALTFPSRGPLWPKPSWAA